MRGTKAKALLFGIMVSVVLAGCGSSPNSKSADALDYSANTFTNGGDNIYMAEEGYAESYASEEPKADARAGRKLIKTANLSVETLEFDKLLAYVEGRTAQLGGYVESMNVYNGSAYNSYTYSGTGYRKDRNASLTLRIPKENLDDFLTEVAENSNITSRSQEERDVTLDYVDLDSHKAVLLAEQERLLTFMEQAETMEDIITLETRLSEIRYQIESMESRLRTYDNQIEYSTVYLSISEVVELTPVATEEKTTWERIGDGFVKSLKNIGTGFKEFFILFIIALPYLVLVGAIAFLIIWIIWLCVKKENAKRARRFAEQQEQQRQYMLRMQGTMPVQPVQGCQNVQPPAVAKSVQPEETAEVSNDTKRNETEE